MLYLKIMTINIWTLMLLFDLIKKMEISKASIAEIESPWWILLSRLKDFVVMTLLTRQYSWFLIRNPFKSILENAPQNHTSVKQLIRNCQPIQKLFQYLLLLGIISSYYLFPYFLLCVVYHILVFDFHLYISFSHIASD